MKKLTMVTAMLAICMIGIIYAGRQDIKSGTYNPFSAGDFAAYETLAINDTAYSDTLYFWSVYHTGWWTLYWHADSVCGDESLFVCFEPAITLTTGFMNRDTIDKTLLGSGDEAWLKTTDIDQYFQGINIGRFLVFGKGGSGDTARGLLIIAPVAK